MADESPPQPDAAPPPEQVAAAQPQAQPQPQEQYFYRQYLQSTAPDGSTTIREIVSPNLLDHDAAIEAEKRAGYTFQNFVDPANMAGVPPAQAAPAQPQPEAPLLPSAVVPTSGAVPASYSAAPPSRGPWADWQQQMPDAISGATAAPGSSPWLNMIPPAMATAGPLALSIFQPELGIPAWIASGGLAALGGAGGEGIREYAAGEPLSPRNIATQGAVSGLTDVGMNTVVNPYVLGPAAKWATGRIGPMLGAAEDLAPTLTAEGTTVTAPRAMAPPPPAQVTMHTIDLAAAKSPEALTEGIQTLAKQATAEERPAIAAAWFATVRHRAADAGDPVTYIKAAYDALGEDTQRALFGSGKGQLERLLGTAWKGGTTEDIANLTLRGGIPGAGGYAAHALGIPNIPGLATTRALGDLSAPFAARQFLVSPGAARFGAGLSSFGGVAGPAASGLAAQSVAERARQAGLPTF